jgi:predicted enzyme related to lactoylglutathione lyase
MTDKIGEMAWLDLSVGNAPQVKDFYQNVIGWQVEEVSMGDYSDFSMNNPESGEPVTGICHAKGVNADLPPAWLPYFLVENLTHSLSQVTTMGGQAITEVKSMGKDKYAVVKDPAGAVCALYQKG